MEETGLKRTHSPDKEDKDVKGNENEVVNEIVSVKQRKLDLDSEILQFGFEGSKEDLAKLSKSSKKRMLKKLKTIVNRPLRRKMEKKKIKLKKIEKKLNNVSLGPSRKMLKLARMELSSCKVTIAIDLSFDDLMSNKDINNCIKQINRCYCVNRRAKNPVQFHVTSFNGKAEEVMSKNNGFRNWDVHFHDKSFSEVFDSKNLVYLTSDSENIICELDESKVYIIGGLVDHNSHKNLCYRIASDQGIAHARLPINEFLMMKTRQVLAINHVFEIMLYVSEGMLWKDAFLKVIPQRKCATEKTELTEDPTDSGQETNSKINNNDHVFGGNLFTKVIEKNRAKESLVSSVVRDVKFPMEAADQDDRRSEVVNEGPDFDSISGGKPGGPDRDDYVENMLVGPIDNLKNDVVDS